MANPTRKHCQSRRDKSRTHWKLSIPALTTCPQCAGVLRPHHVCPTCGYYRGRPLIQIVDKKPAA